MSLGTHDLGASRSRPTVAVDSDGGAYLVAYQKKNASSDPTDPGYGIYARHGVID